MKIGLVAPHIFMQKAVLPKVIFSPGELCIILANHLKGLGHEVTIYSPGPIDCHVHNITADLHPFETELESRGYGYLDLLKKHPLTFISLSRQIQAELISTAYQDANVGKLDVVHVYMNEEDIALQFSSFCNKPVVFTHHDPFNFSTKYRTVMPRYKHLNWLSMSLAQRADMPQDTNWVGNIHHGLPISLYSPVTKPTGDYLLYLGRIIESKGVHLAIAAVKAYNQNHPNKPYKLLIAGKHYSGTKDEYWTKQIEPEIDNINIIYKGFVSNIEQKNLLVANAAALLVPSIFSEPFGAVTIEALACATPVIGLRTGATPEIIEQDITGLLVEPTFAGDDLNPDKTSESIAAAINQLPVIKRDKCRQSFEHNFTAQRMAEQHALVYQELLQDN